jgi:N-acyl-D-aspartate/D-glutamate deacylase
MTTNRSTHHDVVIRGGLIIDGTGRPGRLGDVAIEGGNIVAVGTVTGRGAHEIDAAGLVVTPGFVDGHTHMDAQVFWDELGASSCWHGVTTVVMGNCGFSVAPVRRGHEPLVVRNIERAEDISSEVLAAGLNWSWSTFADYLDAVDRVPKAINYAAYIGHSALRVWAMGERAFEEPASADDLASMTRELRHALRAGAVGLSTSRSGGHQTIDDTPVASRLAEWSEVDPLVRVLGEHGQRLFEVALEPTMRIADEASEFSKLKSLAIDVGTLTLTFGVVGSMRRCGELLEFVDSINAAGGQAFGQTHSRGIANILSFATALPFDTLEGWREVRQLPVAEQLRALRDPTVRERLIAATTHAIYAAATGAEVRPPDYSRMKVLERADGPNKSVAELAAAAGVEPIELLLDLAVATDLQQLFTQPLTSDRESDVLFPLQHEATAMTFSDSGAHVGQISDASIQTYFLAHWVRDCGEFSLEEGVRMMTSVPADRFGLVGRGRLAPGSVADINVFDPDRIAPSLPVVANDLPGGGRRFVQRSVGIATTIVAGVPIIVQGKDTGERPGRLVRRDTIA